MYSHSPLFQKILFNIKRFPPNRYQLWNPRVSDYFTHCGRVQSNHRSLAIPVVKSLQTEFRDQRATEADRCWSPEHQGYTHISTGDLNWNANSNYWSTSRHFILLLQQCACGFVVWFKTRIIQSRLSLTFVFFGSLIPLRVCKRTASPSANTTERSNQSSELQGSVTNEQWRQPKWYKNKYNRYKERRCS